MPNSNSPTFSETVTILTQPNVWLTKKWDGGFNTDLFYLLSMTNRSIIPLSLFSAQFSCFPLESIPSPFYSSHLSVSWPWRSVFLTFSLDGCCTTICVPRRGADLRTTSLSFSVHCLSAPQIVHLCTIDLLLTHGPFPSVSFLFPAPHTQKCDPGQLFLFSLKL